MQLKSISYAVKEHFILKDVCMDLQEGQIAFLFGRNGSGKTTLLNLIAGILNPTDGIMNRSKSSLGKSVFYLPASPYLDSDLLVSDVYDILECDKNLVRHNENLLQTSHLNSKFISQISSGEYKRIWLVAILSVHRKLFLLDEPLVHLDWPFQKALQNLLTKMSSKGHSFIITTHNFNWTLGFRNSYAWILPPPLYKYPIIEALESDKFKKVFQCRAQITDNLLNNNKILLLS